MPEVRKQMHQTTIRFDGELWRRIDAEARRIGVSAAQYIRDATLIRLTQDTLGMPDPGARPGRSGDAFPAVAAALSAADTIGTESQAVWAQARQARERAKGLRDASRRLAESRARRAWSGSSWSEETATQEAST